MIELLVVISIVVLLMALLLPALQRARKQARAAVCQANLKQWGTTFTLYVDDHEGRLPRFNSLFHMMWFLRGSVAGSHDPNKLKASHPIDTKGIACCPMAVKAGGNRFYGTINGEPVEGSIGSTFSAWEVTTPPPPFRTSYGLNGWLCGVGIDTSVPIRTRRLGTDVFSLRGRMYIPMLFDCREPYGQPDDWDRPPPWEGGGRGMGIFCINRHNGYINGLFMDWSVRKVGIKELWTLKWHMQFDTANAWTKAGGVQPEDWPPWMRRFKDY